MGYVRNYDILNEGHYLIDDTDFLNDIFLLHPKAIEEQEEKIEKKSPFYIVNIDGRDTSVFLPNKAVELIHYTQNMLNYIPTGTLIPIGGVDGKFALNVLRESNDKTCSSLGRVIGYDVVDRNNGEILLNGERLFYLDRSVASVFNSLINKKTVIPCTTNQDIFFIKNGCVICNTEQNGYILYDNEGNLIATEYNYNLLLEKALAVKDLEDVNYPKDRELFKRMLVLSLRDSLEEKLEPCKSDDLVDITNYLYENGIQVAVDLDSLCVYKVNYDKCFRRYEQNREKGKTLIKK